MHSTSTRVRDTFHGGRLLQGLEMPLREFLCSQRQSSIRRCTNTSITSKWNTLYPVLTSFRPALSVQRTKITAFNEDYQQPAILTKHRTVTADLPFVNCITGLTIGKQSTSFPIADTSPIETVSDIQGGYCFTSTLIAYSSPTQYVLTDRRVNGSVQKMPATHQRSYLKDLDSQTFQSQTKVTIVGEYRNYLSHSAAFLISTLPMSSPFTLFP